MTLKKEELDFFFKLFTIFFFFFGEVIQRVIFPDIIYCSLVRSFPIHFDTDSTIFLVMLQIRVTCP